MCVAPMVGSVAPLLMTLPAFRAALITSGGCAFIRSRPRLQSRPVVRECRMKIALRANGSDLCALPSLIRPIALVGDGRARMGRCRDRQQRQQQGNRAKMFL